MAHIEQWISTVSEEQLDAGADQYTSGYWEELTPSDILGWYEGSTREAAVSWLSSHGFTDGKDWRVVS